MRTQLQQMSGWLLLLALIVLGWWPGPGVCLASEDCDRSEVPARLGLESGILALPLEEPGVALIKQGPDDLAEQLFWFGYTRDGKLFTNIQNLTSDPRLDGETDFARELKTRILATAPCYGCGNMIPPDSWGERDFNRLRDAGIIAGKRLKSSASCSLEFLLAEFGKSIKPFKSLKLLNKGAMAVFSDPDMTAAAAVWFGWSESGRFLSRCLAADPARSRCGEFLKELEALDHLATCPLLQAGPGDEAGDRELAGFLQSQSMQSLNLGSEPGRSKAGPLDLMVHLLLGLALVALVLTSGPPLYQMFRRDPRFWVAAGLITLLAAGLRLFADPTLPVSSGHGDLTPVKDAAAMLQTGLSTPLTPDNAPAHRVLLAMLYQLFGVSWGLTWGLTLFFGSALVVPVISLTLTLTRHRSAAILAGLATATWPLGLFFSSGCIQVMPAAFYLTSAFALWGSFLEKPTRRTAFFHGLLMFLFVQSRPEAGILALASALVMLALLFDQAGFRSLKKTWWISSLFILALVPYGLLFLRDFEPGGTLPQVRLIPVLLVVTTVLGLVLSRISRTPTVQAAPGWLMPGLSLVMISTLGLLAWDHVLLQGLLSSPMEFPSFPRATLYSVEMLENPPISINMFFRVFSLGLESNVVPLFVLPLVLLGLLPCRRTRRIQPASLMILGLVLFGYGLTGLRVTGILPVEGFRYKMVESGLVPVLLGLGLGRLFDWVQGPVPGKRAHAALVIGFGLLMLSPMATHRAFYLDDLHNPQQEFLFVRDLVRLLPEDSTVVIPDSPLPDHGHGSSKTMALTFRTGDLFLAMGSMEHKQLRIRSIQEALAGSSTGEKQPIYLYLGLNSYRHPGRAGLDSLGREGERLTAAPPVLSRVIENRVYSTIGIGRFSPGDQHLTLKALALEPHDLKSLYEAQLRLFSETAPK